MPFRVTTPGRVKRRDRKRIFPNIQVIVYMERKYLAALLIIVIVAGVALILVASDVAGRTRG